MSAPVILQGFVESVTRHWARGWVRDLGAPARRVAVRAIAEGRVVGEAVAELFRGDVRDAGLGDGNCGFMIDLSPHAAGLGGVSVVLCDAVSGAVVPGAPVVARDPAGVGRFLTRWAQVPAPVLARLRRMMRHRLGRAGVSVVAMQGAPAGLLASLRAQLAGRWELLVPAGAARGRGVREVPAGDDPFAMARHPVVLVVEGAVVLERDALWHVLRALGDGVGVAVWDRLRLVGDAVEVECGPAFDPDGFCSRPVVGGAYAVRRALAGSWGGSAEVVLRVAARHAVAQVPRVLHRVVGPERSVGAAELAAVQAFLGRRATAALDALGIVTQWPQPAGRTLVVVPTKNQGGLLRRCLESLFRTRGEVPMDVVVIDHASDEAATKAYLRQVAGLVRVMPYEGAFDFARMNNQAVARFGGEADTLLFLNNDTEAMPGRATPGGAIGSGWLARMRGLAGRAEVGAVGALLLYGDRRVQHAGVVLGYDGSATHAHALALADEPDGRVPDGRAQGYLGQLVALREVSAVTAACMMVRRAVFDQVGGFDEALPIGFNDTDLCLRLRAAGYRILQDGRSVLFHHESRTRHLTGQWLHPPDTARFQARWAAAIAAGDPFYNPNLQLSVRDHAAREDCLPGGRARVTGGPGEARPR